MHTKSEKRQPAQRQPEADRLTVGEEEGILTPKQGRSVCPDRLCEDPTGAAMAALPLVVGNCAVPPFASAVRESLSLLQPPSVPVSPILPPSLAVAVAEDKGEKETEKANGEQSSSRSVTRAHVEQFITSLTDVMQ